MRDRPCAQSSVYVVDDDEGMRNALSRLFRREGVCVKAFASAEGFLEEYHPDMPGCLLLDVKMPGMGGLELQAALAERRLVLPVIIMTGAADVAMAVQAMKMGAMDFIEKPFEPAPLLVLVRAAIDRDAHERQAMGLRAVAVQKLSLLTGREREVFNLVAQGKPSKVIARELSISPRTVEIHRSRILTKMNIRSVVELVRIANEMAKSIVQTDCAQGSRSDM